MIREYQDQDIGAVVEIWYESSIDAHDFIDPDYWKAQINEMRERYIPMSETYVMVEGAVITGFVSMVDDYLAALFIDRAHQNKGAGRELLDFVKDRRACMKLKVYKENIAAVRFYERNEFGIKEEVTDEQTGRQECVMEWRKPDEAADQ